MQEGEGVQEGDGVQEGEGVQYSEECRVTVFTAGYAIFFPSHPIL